MEIGAVDSFHDGEKIERMIGDKQRETAVIRSRLRGIGPLFPLCETAGLRERWSSRDR